MITTPRADDFNAWVEQLADPIRSRRAYRHLLLSGSAALPAVRGGLRHANPAVRMFCTRALDHLVDPESYDELIAMLDDADPGVRLHALHALACDRCKDTDYRPAKEAILTPAIQLLLRDPDKHVRAMAAELVGCWVHSDATASDALIQSRDGDPAPAVRKKSGWYAPGGTIYRKRVSRKLRGRV
jgi:HEAT repeat protein